MLVIRRTNPLQVHSRRCMVIRSISQIDLLLAAPVRGRQTDLFWESFVIYFGESFAIYFGESFSIYFDESSIIYFGESFLIYFGESSVIYFTEHFSLC